MDNVLFSYTADSTDKLFMYLGAFIALGAFFLCYKLLQRKFTGRKHTTNALIAMLIFFLGLMATGTAFFSGWSYLRQGKVSISSAAIQIGSKTIPFDNIRKMYLKQDKSASVFQSSALTQVHSFFVIEDKDGRIYPLSENDYPINEIMGHLKDLTKKNK